MGHSSAVGFLAFALCLVACVPGINAADINDGGKQAVEAAKKSAKEVCEKALMSIDSANVILQRVEPFKKKAEKIKNQAAQALLEAEKTAKENIKAKAIAGGIKSISDRVATLHQDVTGELAKTVSASQTWLSEAKALKTECDKEIPLIAGLEANHQEASNKAAALKTKEVELDKSMAAVVALVNTVDSTGENMVQNLTKAQLGNLHVSVIVGVTKIETIVGDAESTIKEIQNKINEVNDFIEQMKTRSKTPTGEVNEKFNVLCESANDELTKATSALGKAQTARESMEQQKVLADFALKNIEKATKVNKAQEEVTKAKTSVMTVEKIVPELNSALQTARNAVTSANGLKQEMETALSSATSEKLPEQSEINTQVKTLQNSVSASVTQIRTMMNNAGITLQSTTKHKEDVNAIVEEMKKLFKTDITEANDIIQALYKGANDELTTATGALQNATKAIAAMTEQQRIADAALTRVAAAKEVTKAQQEDNTAAGCVAKVTEIVSQLQSTLQTASNSLTNATLLKQKFVAALTATTSEPITDEVKETAKSDISVGEDKEPDQKDATVQPTITDTEQPASKELLSQSDNNVKKLKDILMKGAQNGTTLPLTGGKVPELGAKNDSAMTVSVPLLVALIASAVLP